MGYLACAYVIALELPSFLPTYFSFLISFVSIGAAFFVGAHFIWVKKMGRFEGQIVQKLLRAKLIELRYSEEIDHQLGEEESPGDRVSHDERH